MSEPLTFAERLEAGQRQRKHMRRADHAGWDAKARKKGPAALLKQSDKGRVPKLMKLKYERMALSPFSYFRGAAPVMAYDLSLGKNSGILNQICGDAHVNNLGAFEGPDGNLAFDINDFDESMIGPFEWDVKRMATSILLAGHTADLDNVAPLAVKKMLKSYRLKMLALTKMTMLEVVRYQVKRLKSVPAIEELLDAAKQSTPLQTLDTLTELQDGKRIIRSKTDGSAKVLWRVTGSEAQSVIDSLETYKDSLLPERRRLFARYRVVDVGFKVVGTGSVGLRDFVIYLEGNGDSDPLFLQVKEEAASAYTPYLGAVGSAAPHQGRRVAEAERAMQLQSDPFLGWTSFGGRDYLVRQLNDHKAVVDITELNSSTLPEYAAVCGELLARGHARAGDCVTIAGYLGNSNRFDKAILDFAREYAKQTVHDWKKMVAEHRH